MQASAQGAVYLGDLTFFRAISTWKSSRKYTRADARALYIGLINIIYYIMRRGTFFYFFTFVHKYDRVHRDLHIVPVYLCLRCTSRGHVIYKYIYKYHILYCVHIIWYCAGTCIFYVIICTVHVLQSVRVRYEFRKPSVQ